MGSIIKEETPEQRLEYDIKELRRLAVIHKRADVDLSRNGINFSIQETQRAKDKIQSITKQMKPLIKKVEAAGFKWEPEKERRAIKL